MRGFVLAGGRSSRMGEDKALVCFPGDRPMAIEVASMLSTLCATVFMIRRAPCDALIGWPILLDEPGHTHHPLWGVARALTEAQGQPILIAPCDTPLLQPTSMKKLIPQDDELGRVACCEGRLHPLIAGLSPQLLPRTLRFAREGQSVRRWAKGFTQVELSPTELKNVNSPNDLFIPQGALYV